MRPIPRFNFKFTIPKACILTFVLMSLSFLLISPTHSKEKRIVGWIEMAKVYPEDFLIRAKLDTGAENSSIDAENINVFRRKGRRWVRFDVSNHIGQKFTLERKVRRVVRIKEHAVEYQRRFVVKLGLCMGDLYKEADVNLTDRSNFDTPLLIGRSFMEGDIVVDPSIQSTLEPKCQGVTAP